MRVFYYILFCFVFISCFSSCKRRKEIGKKEIAGEIIEKHIEHMHLERSIEKRSEFLNYHQRGLWPSGDEVLLLTYDISKYYEDYDVPYSYAALCYDAVGFVNPYMGYQDYDVLIKFRREQLSAIEIANKVGGSDGFRVYDWYLEPEYDRVKRLVQLGYKLENISRPKDDYIYFISYFFDSEGYYTFKTATPAYSPIDLKEMHQRFFDNFKLNKHYEYDFMNYVFAPKYANKTVSEVVIGPETKFIGLLGKFYINAVVFIVLIFTVFFLVWDKLWSNVDSEDLHNL